MHQRILWDSGDHMDSVGLFSIIKSQTKVRKPPVKGLTKPLVCKAIHCGTGYSEVWQGICLYVSHHLLEQTTLILCSYLEVTLRPSRSGRQKQVKNIYLENPK